MDQRPSLQVAHKSYRFHTEAPRGLNSRKEGVQGIVAPVYWLRCAYKKVCTCSIQLVYVLLLATKHIELSYFLRHRFKNTINPRWKEIGLFL